MALLFDQRHHPYRLPELERLEVTYGTPMTVHVAPPGGQRTGTRRQTLQQSHCYCLPDEAAWDRVTAAHGQMQQALNDLAQELRQFGTYAARLSAAGGVAQANLAITYVPYTWTLPGNRALVCLHPVPDRTYVLRLFIPIQWEHRLLSHRSMACLTHDGSHAHHF